MRFAFNVLFFTALFGVAHALAQECVVPRPPAPPKAAQVIITLPPDGGASGCTAVATAPSAPGAPRAYPFRASWCAVARQFGDQAVAVDNGWNDGGTP
jgi:hypothetical protein